MIEVISFTGPTRRVDRQYQVTDGDVVDFWICCVGTNFQKKVFIHGGKDADIGSNGNFERGYSDNIGSDLFDTFFGDLDFGFRVEVVLRDKSLRISERWVVWVEEDNIDHKLMNNGGLVGGVGENDRFFIYVSFFEKEPDCVLVWCL